MASKREQARREHAERQYELQRQLEREDDRGIAALIAIGAAGTISAIFFAYALLVA